MSVQYTTKEGGKWQDWPRGKAIPNDVWFERRRDPSYISYAIQDSILEIHAIKLTDGAIWDCINGWRESNNIVEIQPAPLPSCVREQVLDSAKVVIMGQREDEYGSPRQNFASIADLWTIILRGKLKNSITLTDVALMMDAVKTARLINQPNHADSWVDKAGYSACGAEVAGAKL